MSARGVCTCACAHALSPAHSEVQRGSVTGCQARQGAAVRASRRHARGYEPQPYPKLHSTRHPRQHPPGRARRTGGQRSPCAPHAQRRTQQRCRPAAAGVGSVLTEVGGRGTPRQLRGWKACTHGRQLRPGAVRALRPTCPLLLRLEMSCATVSPASERLPDMRPLLSTGLFRKPCGGCMHKTSTQGYLTMHGTEGAMPGAACLCRSSRPIGASLPPRLHFQDAVACKLGALFPSAAHKLSLRALACARLLLWRASGSCLGGAPQSASL